MITLSNNFAFAILFGHHTVNKLGISTPEEQYVLGKRAEFLLWSHFGVSKRNAGIHAVSDPLSNIRCDLSSTFINVLFMCATQLVCVVHTLDEQFCRSR